MTAVHTVDDTSAILDAYRATLWKRLLVLLMLVIAITVAVCIDLVTGPSSVTVADAVRALLGIGTSDPSVTVIVWNLRLPYAVMALLVGAALSLAGAEMQTILNNPLASPFTLGLSSAAILGAALAIVLNVAIAGVSNDWIISVFAFVFAFLSVLLLQLVVRIGRLGAETLVLFGIALFFTFNSIVAILQFIASDQALQQLVFWTMGSLGRTDWPKIALLAGVLIVVGPWSWASSWQLTALRLGEDRARSFGVDVDRLRLWSLLRISLLTGVAVAFVGTIAFIGLVGPHIARMLVGEDHRYFLPGSALLGALLMSLASIASKTAIPGAVIPIGLVTALIGVPFFMSLLLARRRMA
ncbi:MAG: iron ABC transporter permease [Vicinamibacterales bacterium]